MVITRNDYQLLGILMMNDLQTTLMTRAEAADYLGLAPHTLAVWQSTNRYGLPCVKIGRLAKYRKEDLDDFIQRRTTGKTQGS